MSTSTNTSSRHASPLDPATLFEENTQLRADLAEAHALIRMLKGQRFAASSERDIGPAPLFPDAETSGEMVATATGDDVTQVPAHTRKKKRKTIPDHLPREVVTHDLADSDKVCPEHGVSLERGADKVTEKLEMQPAKVWVLEERIVTYCCPICDKTVREAKAPASILPGTVASASLLAHIATAKYADGLPLYRQEQILLRHGVELTRTTMANWMIALASALTPLRNLFADVVLSGDVVYVDETHHQVHGLAGKSNTHKSYMWVRVGGQGPRRVVLFDSGPSRSASVAKELLSGFAGTVVTDGCESYGFIALSENMVRAQCWMHVRRHFTSAQKTLGKAGRGGVADQALGRIRELYAIERDGEAMSTAERRALREERSVPLLAAFRAWLTEQAARVPPKGVTRQGHHLRARKVGRPRRLRRDRSRASRQRPGRERHPSVRRRQEELDVFG